MRLLKNSALLAAGLVVALNAAAQSPETESRIYINPAIGYQDFDHIRDLAGEELLSIGGEYRFGEHWATELRWMESDPESDLDGSNVDLTQISLDAIYYWGRGDNNFDPYFAAGVGHAEFDGDTSTDQETQYDLGVGVRYWLNQNWSLKADTKLIYGGDDDTIDRLFTLGLSYAFGDTKKAVVVLDADNDGVVDADDQCPNTPAGAAVDARGCALDTDGDGVADYKDNCPATPAGREVDSKGCKLVLMRSVEMTLNVNFASNSDVVTDANMADIEKVASFMGRYTGVAVVVEGHTDNTGNADYNESLSQRRADAVIAVLVERFNIDASRLSAKGFGESQPIAGNDTQEGRLTNRRVVAVMKAEVEEK